MLNVVVVGCGDLGSQHANAWSLRDDAQVVAVCDLDSERASLLGEKYGAATYDDWREAIAHEGADVVSVCTPVCFHAPVTIAATELKRHVLCEKPIALTLEDADAMIEAANRNGVKLATSYQLRGMGRYVTLKRLIGEGKLGSPLFLRFTDIREVRPKLAMHRKSMNGGPIHDMSGHFFDLARWLTGAEPTQIMASGHVFGRGKARLESIDDYGLDAAEILVRLENGHTLSININWGMPESMPPYGWNDVICGPEAMARVDIAEDRLILHDATGEYVISCPENPVGPSVRINDLIDAIQSGSIPEVDGRAGRAALHSTLAAIESAASGNPVGMPHAS